MKKLILITGIILIGCVLISVLAATRTVTEPVHAPAQNQADAGYVIRDNGGKIAVFRAGESTPFMTTETYTKTLPRADSTRLQNGIAVTDKAELQRLLEDFCS